MNPRKHELIGLEVEIVRSTDAALTGLRGRIVDETRNTLLVEAGGREKRIPKHGNRFRFDVQGGTEIEGDDIRFRPEERIKRAR